MTLPLCHPCPHSALHLPPVSWLPLTACVRSNSNRAAIGHLHRQLYGRRYPVLLVSTDGSTVRLRYSEPKRILMVRARRGLAACCAPGGHGTARPCARAS